MHTAPVHTMVVSKRVAVLSVNEKMRRSFFHVFRTMAVHRDDFVLQAMPDLVPRRRRWKGDEEGPYIDDAVCYWDCDASAGGWCSLGEWTRFGNLPFLDDACFVLFLRPSS